MHLEHIWFDCDGTLYVLTPEIANRRDEQTSLIISKEMGLPQIDVMQKFQSGRRRYGTRALAVKNEFGYSGERSREIASSADITDLLQPDPLLTEKLIELKQKGLDISIYTNSLRPRLTDILAILNISSSLFRYTITIEDGGGKPAGFGEVLARSKCNPSEIMFVGDNPQADIEPARNCRMHTLLVGAEKPFMEFDEEKGTYHFKRKTIYEVVSVVGELGEL